jgi:cyclin-dependent kinase regulatory subunit CKS1
MEDDVYQYIHIILPFGMAAQFYNATQGSRLLTRTQWRVIGVNLSDYYWEHYAIHAPEPHILMLRRPRVRPRARLYDI